MFSKGRKPISVHVLNDDWSEEETVSEEYKPQGESTFRSVT